MATTSDLSNIGWRYIDIPDPTAGDNAGIATGAEFFNKATGQVITPNERGEITLPGLSAGQALGIDSAGNVVVNNPVSDSFFGGLFGRVEDIVTNPGVQYIATAALLGNAAAGALGGAGAGAGVSADASFLAADASQLAAQGLSESQIASTLGASGYASTGAANLAASMAANGLTEAQMAQQLTNLSANTGLFQQNLSPGEFAAYDATQLQKTVGNNFAAIEQNLIASGVDPLVAADISQQLAFTPGITQAELASNLTNTFGTNIYDVNTAALYPTSTLGGIGGTLADLTTVGTTGGFTPSPDVVTTPTTTPSTTPTTTTTAPTTTSPSSVLSSLSPTQLSSLVKAGVSLAGLLGGGAALSNLGSGGTSNVGSVPTQAVPTYTPEYYNQLQQYYNTYLPEQPRDVTTALKQWYSSPYSA